MWSSLALFLSTAFWFGPSREIGSWWLDRPVEVVVEARQEWKGESGRWHLRSRLLRLRQGRKVVCAALPLGISVAAETPPAPANKYRLRGYLTPPHRFRNQPSVTVGSWQLRVKSDRFVSIEESLGIGRVGLRLRRRLLRSMGSLDPESPGRGLVEALVLGRSDRFPEDWKRALRRLGLAHVLAVSGLHVGLLAGLLWLVGRPLPVRLRVTLALAVVWTYGAVVGGRPSVRRAVLMVSVLLLTRLLQRPPDAGNSLALAVLGLLLQSPSLVWDLAFQLSVAATAGILFLGPRLAAWWELENRWWGRGLAAGLAAHLVTLPISVPAFSQLPVAAPLLSLLVVPWTSLALTLALLCSAFGMLVPWSVNAMGAVLDVAAAPFGLLALLPLTPLLSIPLVLDFGVALCLAVLLTVLLRWGRRGGWLALALTAGLVWVPRSRGTEVILLDVGQGDSVLLRDAGGALLVDGGGWREGDFGGRVLKPALAGQGIRSLDVVIVTHPDRDHCGGLEDLRHYLRIDELWIGPGWSDAPCIAALLSSLSGKVKILWRGDTVRWRHWSFRVLHPQPGRRGSRNNRSLVLVAQAWGHRILLTGDIDATIEDELLRTNEPLGAEILKVAHHGSRSSTSEVFLDAVWPRWALISVGSRNSYGHPSDQVLARLERHRVRTLRTDLHGMIRLSLRPSAPLGVEITGVPLAPRFGRPARRRVAESWLLH